MLGAVSWRKILFFLFFSFFVVFCVCARGPWPACMAYRRDGMSQSQGRAGGGVAPSGVYRGEAGAGLAGAADFMSIYGMMGGGRGAREREPDFLDPPTHWTDEEDTDGRMRMRRRWETELGMGILFPSARLPLIQNLPPRDWSAACP